MTSKEQQEIYEGMHSKIMQITKSKAHDYAGKDVLSNFKSVSGAAQQLGIDVSTATGYALFMVVLKLARLGNLISAGKTPNNESIDDSFLDGINYFKLAYCCYVEASSKELPIEVNFDELKKNALNRGSFEEAAKIRDLEKQMGQLVHDRTLPVK